MSLHIPTIRAKLAAAKAKVQNLGHPPSPTLLDALAEVEKSFSIWEECVEHPTRGFSGARNECFQLIFSAAKIQSEIDLLRNAPEAEPLVVEAHIYIFSLQTYKARQWDDGYFNGRINMYSGIVLHGAEIIGPEYLRFLDHKFALKNVTSLLTQQKNAVNGGGYVVRQTDQRVCLDWWENMANLGEKLNGWCKEMEWIDTAFQNGYDPNN
ncbi:MAG: hypothetical protein Q9221_006857 [Calogaya cf. arnoldii]